MSNEIEVRDQMNIVPGGGFGEDMFGEDDLPVKEERSRIPRMFIGQGMSQVVLKGDVQVGNFYVVQEDAVYDLGPEVNVAFIPGGWFEGRTMWAYDKQGKRDTASGNKPWCGSNNGKSARPEFLAENREGDVLSFEDWRDGSFVNIHADCCESCPLGQWKPIRNEDGTTKRNAAGKVENGKPPCSKSQTFLFYVKEFGGAVFFQGSNFIVSSCLDGRTERHSLKPEARGIRWFYELPKSINGKKVHRPAWNAQEESWMWINLKKNRFTTKSGSGWGFLPEVGSVMDPDSTAAWQGVTTLMREQKAQIEEDMAATSTQNEDTDPESEATPAEPF